MQTDPWAWALFFVVDCLALYAVAGVLTWRLAGRASLSLSAREWVLLVSLGGLAGQAVATCCLLALNGWF